MANVSDKELLVPYGTYYDMNQRVEAFKKSEKKNPAHVYLVKNGKDYISYSRYLDMNKRVVQYFLDNPNKTLNNVWIKKPASSSNVLSSNSSTAVPTVNINGTKYQPSSMTKFYGLMGGFGYSYYYNDILTLAQEIKALSNGKAMNCTDFAQLGVYIASQYKKDGKPIYQTRYVHINCKSGGGHTTFQIKGGEFGSTWTMIDLAAKADKNSRIYPIGDYWCKTGTIRGYNEVWVVSDDGKT